MPELNRLRAAYEQAKAELLAERTPDGHWVGELSSSALSTATAVSALVVVRRAASGRRQPPDGDASPLNHEFLDSLISRGVDYLAAQQNPDGGFGDTDLSHSNIATTYLVVAALHLAGVADEHAGLLARADAYLEAKGRLAGLRERYGIDKTFVVPIMTNLALAGLLDWREIDPLPFELACVPQSLYRFVGMPVVSYAIPALVAIGQARYHHAPPWNPLTRLVRWLSVSRSLKVLRSMQPDSGGYLEATPLTSFVVMSLASLTKPRPVVGVKGEQSLPQPTDSETTVAHMAPRPLVGALNPLADAVIESGVKFLANSIRPDGSWPIDTNLATWNTTLAINALAGAGEDVADLLGPQCLDWLLSCQHLKRHPFTGADPDGFGWSDLSGAVPDADDTSGAVMAIASFRRSGSCEVKDKRQIAESMIIAGAWLVGLRNHDRGWPTFCRGWGRLPFDRSGTDLTAHVSRSFVALHELMDEEDEDLDRWFFKRYDFNMLRRFNGLALRSKEVFLDTRQHPDGAWSPLWFGNQDHLTEDNPVYGTAKVLMAYRDLGLMDSPEAKRGVAWLVANQNDDGGWGSGVWGRLRSAEPNAPAGVESGHEVTRMDNSGHSVGSTQCSVSKETRAAVAEVDDKLPQGAHAPRAPSDSHLTSSVEETALAIEALLAVWRPTPDSRSPTPEQSAVEKGLTWLIERVECGEHRQPAPIGFYFAKLWYYERLYPLTFTVAALGRACRQFAGPAAESDADRQPESPPEPAKSRAS